MDMSTIEDEFAKCNLYEKFQFGPYRLFDSATSTWTHKHSPFYELETKVKPTILVSRHKMTEVKELFTILSCHFLHPRFDVRGTEQEIISILDVIPLGGCELTITNCKSLGLTFFHAICAKFKNITIIPSSSNLAETWLNDFKTDKLTLPQQPQLMEFQLYYSPNTRVCMTYTEKSENIIETKDWHIMELTDEQKKNGYTHHTLTPKYKNFLWYEPQGIIERRCGEGVLFRIRMSTRYPYAIIQTRVAMTTIQLQTILPQTRDKALCEIHLIALPGYDLDMAEAIIDLHDN